MLVAVVCVLCVQFGGILMNITHAGEAHNVFTSLYDDCGSPTGCLRSLKTPAVPVGISVSCSPSVMLVHVKADLFNLGAAINPDHLTLGGRCEVTRASPEEFIIHSALNDCGMRYWLTNDSLVYTNILVYTPLPSVHGVIRHEPMSVPVQCVYSRRIHVTAVSVVPMWLPHLSSHTAEHTLHFSLRLMNSDWQVMENGVYLLGDVMNMEVSVFTPRLDLWVFIQDCVATTARDAQSGPSYKFIQNGCFVDGLKMSSVSRFLPRIHPNKLQLQLHTYIFKQVHSKQIFISCRLKADQSSFLSRACSYIHGRSTDGVHSVCEGCRMSDLSGEEKATQASSVQVGPLTLFPWSEMSPPGVLEGDDIINGPTFKRKWLPAHTLQGNLSVFSEEVESQNSSSAGTKDVITPEFHLTVPPLMITTLETINSAPKTKPTAAVLEHTESWSTELNTREEKEEDSTSDHTGFGSAVM